MAKEPTFEQMQEVRENALKIARLLLPAAAQYLKAASLHYDGERSDLQDQHLIKAADLFCEGMEKASKEGLLDR